MKHRVHLSGSGAIVVGVLNEVKFCRCNSEWDFLVVSHKKATLTIDDLRPIVVAITKPLTQVLNPGRRYIFVFVIKDHNDYDRYMELVGVTDLGKVKRNNVKGC